MAKLYKITNSKGCTRDDTQWGPGVLHEAPGSPNQVLCTDGWIHAYENPDMAVLMNPAHSNYSPFLLWDAEGEVGLRDGFLKCGCRSLRTIKQIEIPEWSQVQIVAFAVLAAKAVGQDRSWIKWADDWLSGKDRTAGAAGVATGAAWAAGVATRAAWAAGVATGAARATGATRAAKAAAWAAAWAAGATGATIDWPSILQQAKAIR